MLPKVVVVAPLSPSKTCIYCNQDLAPESILCSSCKKVQPVPSPQPSYFSLLGFEPMLDLPESELRNRFYSLSQKVHPDTHVLKDSYEQSHASQWSALLNRAYQTLRTPHSRIDYLLELFPKPSQLRPNIPTDLAESFFELQELISEGDALGAIQQFESQLQSAQERYQSDWQKLVTAWNSAPEKSTLIAQLHQLNHHFKYLASLKENLKKLQGRL
ncbi:Fe-S protein assembly co-chaperone HscB [bacterium]|nr:Fe-S protein assembly co-chaperone HscB [bacterium]